MSIFYKTVIVGKKGVDVSVKPHLITPDSWLTLTQLHTLRGQIENFPGWKTILDSGDVGGFGTLAAEFEDNAGDIAHIFGGPTKVYQYNPTLRTLIERSADLTPNVPTRDNPWSWFVYKNALYLGNRGSGFYKWQGLNIVSIPDAPKARSYAVLNDHICALNTVDSVRRFQWAAEGSETVWTAAADNDAGLFELDNTPGVGVALVPFDIDLVAYKADSIITLAFVGGNEVFGVRSELKRINILGPEVVVDTGVVHIIMGQEFFYRYRGGRDLDENFGQAIHDKVYDDLHATYRNRARSFYIRGTREAVFAYPSLASSGDCDKCVVYNVDDDAWYGPFAIDVSMFGRTARERTSLAHPINLFVTSSGDILEIGAAQDNNGSTITRAAETGDQNIGIEAVDGSGKAVSFPLGMVYTTNVLNVDFEPTAGTGRVRIGYRMELNDPIVYTDYVDFALSPAGNVKIPFRTTGRWFRVSFSLPASVDMHLIGYQYEFFPVGRR